MNYLPYGKQDINQDYIDAVINVLKSDWLTTGPFVKTFEETIAKHTHSNHAVSFNSATSALHVACLALGVSEGDYVWTSPISFVASSNCALYCGANVDFVDIDSKTFNLCPLSLEEKLKTAEKEGRLPKILVPVHLAGQPCDMKRIYQLSRQYGFKIIEDASHAIGANYEGKPIGDCRYSDIAVFSFHPVKIATSGEGGVATTNQKSLAVKMNYLRNHGITRDPSLMGLKEPPPWYYEQIALGYNYRLSDIHAALGTSQMGRLKDFVARRREIASFYDREFKDFPLRTQTQIEDATSSWHLYIIRLNLTELSKGHLKIFQELREAGLGVNLHYIPIYKQPFYRKNISLGNAEQYYKEAISLPIFPKMSDAEVERVTKTVEKVLA